MPTTYNPDLATPKDQVRFLVRDNVVGSMILDDGEIAWLLSTEANVYMAAAAAADILAQRAPTIVSSNTSGPISRKRVANTDISYDTKTTQVDEYRQLASSLRARGQHAAPVAGGISIAAKNEQRSNDDRTRPSFYRGLHETDRGAFESRDDLLHGDRRE